MAIFGLWVLTHTFKALIYAATYSFPNPYRLSQHLTLAAPGMSISCHLGELEKQSLYTDECNQN